MITEGSYPTYSEEKRFRIVRVSYIIAEGSKDGEEDQVLDAVKGAVQGMHQVVKDPRKIREGKGLEMFLSGKAVHQINLGTYQDVLSVIQLCTG